MTDAEGMQQLPPGAEADNNRGTTAEFADAQTRFRSYVTLHSNLDNLIWRNVTSLLTITAIGGALMGTLLTRPDFQVVSFTHNQTVSAAFLLLAMLYGVSVFTLRRMRYHHVLAEQHLRRLEPSGYFHDREKSVRRWWSSATTWNMIVFGFLSLICILAAAFYLLKGNEMAKTWISAEQASSQYGIYANHEIMDNGEVRFRLMSIDGSGYIRTVAPPEGGWQRSHFHKQTVETYVIESGWMGVAVPGIADQPIALRKVEAGAVYNTQLGEVHNIYLPAKSIIHTVKHVSGRTESSDWFSAPDFDKLTIKLTEKDFLAADAP